MARFGNSGSDCLNKIAQVLVINLRPAFFAAYIDRNKKFSAFKSFFINQGKSIHQRRRVT